MKLPLHDRFIEQAIEYVSQDQRLIGLLAGGSMMYGEMDEYSDLDLIIVYNHAFRSEIMEQRLLIAEKLGNLLSAFTGEHVGEPRLLICLYGPTPLHVDLKFVQLEELESRIENPLILWERGTDITMIISKTSPVLPFPHHQWIEDRFWERRIIRIYRYFNIYAQCSVGPVGTHLQRPSPERGSKAREIRS